MSEPLTIQNPWEPSTACGATGAEHCAHPSGVGIGYGNGAGYVTYICCHCGQEAYVQWKKVRRGVLGHGPHFGPADRVQEWPEGWKLG